MRKMENATRYCINGLDVADYTQWSNNTLKEVIHHTESALVPLSVPHTEILSHCSQCTCAKVYTFNPIV